jgi:sugar O-acyltransferase (sialic acid O-acetyltransferase NeuD family)
LTPKKDIILIGGGGHCLSVIDVIESTELYTIKGILDVKEKVGAKIMGYEIIGTDDDIHNFKSVQNFCITVGQIKSSQIRKTIYDKVKQMGGILPSIVASTAYISKYATFGDSNIIMHHSFINAGVNIGNNNILNTKCLIEHGTTIGNHNHISTASVINADCKIGNSCLIGSKAIINRGLEIGNEIIIGSGSVVTKKIEEKGLYIGNPCKFVD